MSKPIGRIEIKHIVMPVLECPMCDWTYFKLKNSSNPYKNIFVCNKCKSTVIVTWTEEYKAPVAKDGKFYISDKAIKKLI